MVNYLMISNDSIHSGTSWTSGTDVVDMTNLNPSFQYSLSNPIAIIPPPTPATPSPLAYANNNGVAINIGMMFPTIRISFIDVDDGLGNDPFNSTGTTTFQKLYRMAYQDKYRKLLFVNTLTNPNFVQITSWTCSVSAGQKNISNHNLVLAVVGAASM